MPKFNVLTKQQIKERKIEKEVKEICKKADEQHRAKAHKTLELIKQGQEIKDATIEIYGEDFYTKAQKILDKIECEDVLRDYF